MNERIRALALQALKQPDTDNDGLTVFDNDELEKFAELIVKKCADVAKYYTPDTEECEHTWLIHDKIKQHFGVEQ